MANIRKLPSGNWNAQVRLKGQSARSKTFPTVAEAKAWARSLEAIRKPSKEYTIQTLGLTYRETKLKGKSSYTHTLVYIKQLAKAFPQPLREISPQLVNDFKLKRLKEVRPATVRKQLECLSRFFQFAKKELLIRIDNPVAAITLPASSRASDKVVSRTELDQLLAHLSPVMSAIVEVAYETAMRRSEIVNLTPGHLHLDERIADVIDGKNGTRSVPLTRRAIEILDAASQSASRKDERLFPVTAHAVSTAVRRARTQAGLSPLVRLHQLRHTRITNVAKKGFNNAQIMVVSGHRDTRSVARYTHLSVKDVLHLID